MSQNSGDVITDHTEWTREHEEILKEWKAKAFAYLWLQNNSCYHYLRIQNWLAYTVIVLSSVSSATMFSVTPNTDGSSNVIGVIPIYVIQYIIGSLSLLSAILTGVIRQLKPGEMYQQHASTAKKYHNLIRSIDACLSLTRILRPNPALFIERAGAELDTLANTQLEPPLFVIRRFESVYGPLERVLYGEDVVELWKLTYATNKLEQKMRNNLVISSNRTPEHTSNAINQIPEGINLNINDMFDRDLEQGIKGNTPKNVKDSIELQTHEFGGKYLINKFSEPFKTSVKIP